MANSTVKAIIGTFILAFGTHAAGDNVFEKVVRLLQRMSGDIAKEGKEEAAAYDKYACFCKEQADEKLYAIEKSQSKIGTLNAEIKELTSAIAYLNGDDGISGLNQKISQLEKDINAGEAARNQDQQLYQAKARDMDEAISASANAYDSIAFAKKSMKGAKVDLLQVKKLQDLVAKQSLVSKDSLKLLAVGSGPGPARYQLQSNDILATIQALQRNMIKMKKELDTDEAAAAHQWDQKRMALDHEKTFSQKDLEEKERLSESKNEALEEAKLSKDAESKDMTADSAYLDKIKADCEAKAKSFDETSTTRSAELSAITKALEALNDGDVGKMSDRMTAQLQLGTKPKVASGLSQGPATRAAFIQLRSVRHHLSDRKAAINRVKSFIAKSAKMHDSPKLNALAVRLTLTGDNFVKVRGLVKDLLARLDAQAKAEASQKGFCDKSMSEALTGRDDAQSNIEAASAKISTLTAAINSLAQENADLEKEIAEMMKGLNEAEEVRSDDKAHNMKSIAMAQEATLDTKAALESLQSFYAGDSFIQRGAARAPITDRSGNTIGDLAPEETKYEKKTASAKGVLGLLEVLLSDFERAQTSAEDTEKEQNEDFVKFKSSAKEDVANLRKRIEGNDSDSTDKQTDLMGQQQELKDNTKLLASAEEQLESLKASCIDDDSQEGRFEARMSEVNALKDALNLLESWSEDA